MKIRIQITDTKRAEEKLFAPFEVVKHTTILREGIHYNDLNEGQRDQLEDQVVDPELVDYKEQVDKRVFNKDTDRAILRTLMEKAFAMPMAPAWEKPSSSLATTNTPCS